MALGLRREKSGPWRPVGLAGLPTPAGLGALSLLHSLEERGRQERKEKNREKKKKRDLGNEFEHAGNFLGLTKKYARSEKNR